MKTDRNDLPLILIVDDNPQNIQVLGNMLGTEGFRVAIARDGSQALSYINEKRHPDLLLLDVMMPEIDGFEVCRRLKSDAQTANIPIIFLTALVDKVNKIKGFNLGGEDYITKPFEQAEVLARINSILKRKLAEEALHKSEEMLSSTLDSMADPVYVLDEAGTVLECYHSSETEVPQLAPEHSIGKHYSEIFSSGDAEKINKAIQQTIETGKAQLVESAIKINRKKNWYSTKFSVRKDNNGVINGITAVARNITEQKLAVQTLRESDRMKSEFVSSVSHELRTPLASIMGFSDTILRSKELDAETERQFIQIIHNESDRLARLIENVLSISRIEAGNVKYKLEPLEPSLIISEVFKSHRMLAEEKDIVFSVDVNDDLPLIAGDRDALQQALINVVGNAIKFTPENGSVELTARSNGESIYVTVKDTGIGIPQDDLPKIFNKFYRVYRPGMEIRGTGLGLALTKNIIDFHKGGIQVQSEEHKGTTVTINLPIKKAPRHERKRRKHIAC